MKPTEADIQAELIEGWELQQYFDPLPDKIRIVRQSLAIGFYEEDRVIIFNYGDGYETKIIRMSELMRGDCDLSAISDHYSYEEWSKIITMCKSIVRLITGEQVEQSLEEKVREIFEPFYTTQTIQVSPWEVVITEASGVEVVITNETIRVDETWETGSSNEWGLLQYESLFETPEDRAYVNIAALLTEQPEQTLEEAVRGWLKNIKDVNQWSTHEDRVEVSVDGLHYWIYANEIQWCNRHEAKHGPICHLDIYAYLNDRNKYEWVDFVRKVSFALQSTRSTNPSYSELEQRVEELEKEVRLQTISANCDKENVQYWRRNYEALLNTTSDLEQKYSDLERENASLLDKFGPIDQAEQQVAEVETRFQKLAKKAERIADIMIQLNEEIL